MPTRVKICGITRAEDAQLAAELGAAALGFNFYSKSPRSIAPAAATRIIRALPPFVVPVGIFADEVDGDHILAVAGQAGVQALQIHGPRLPDLDTLRERYPLILAVSVGVDFQVSTLGETKASAYLLDSFDPQLRGGTGRTFDWSLAHKAAPYGPIIVAGGLTPENVGEAIRHVKPYAVDVASGVESAPGIKDAGKMRAFFAAVAEANRGI
ncbi:MAG: phosphoribosylanthranilate isomerase [Acidobacteria bacterium]|nr:phosphoribosylanthranilate isomerase [Acidobacteriota bacterium]